MNINSQRLGISDIIGQIQSELIESEEYRRKNKIPSLFETQSCEIEIKFVVKVSTSASGKIDLKLVALNFGENAVDEVVHSLKVRFDVPRAENRFKFEDELEKPNGRRPRQT